MAVLAPSTISTLAAPVLSALKDCSKRFVRETAGLAAADMLQQQTVVVSAEGVCERYRGSHFICLSASCHVAQSV